MVLVLVILICVSASAIVDSRKTKRLIGGSSIVRNDNPYLQQMNYLVWIGRDWTCDEEGSIIFGPCGIERARRQRLTGALISPHLVQTVCSHVAVFEIVEGRFMHWDPSRAPTYWENKLNVYMGGVDVETFIQPIKVKRIYKHYNCARLGKIMSAYIRYDVAWLLTEIPLSGVTGPDKLPWGNNEYAPLFKRDQLKQLHEQVLRTMPVCLMIGYGYVEFNNDQSQEDIEKRGNEGPASRFLKHGWIQTMSATECEVVTTKLYDLKPYYFDYSKSGSWVCSTKAGGEIGVWHTLQDYGTPITCNNNYLYLASNIYFLFGEKHENPPEYFQLDTALSFVPESMCTEFRRRFEEELVGGFDFKHDLNPDTPELSLDARRKHLRKKLAYSEKQASSVNAVEPPSFAGNAVSPPSSSGSTANSRTAMFLFSTFLITSHQQASDYQSV